MSTLNDVKSRMKFFVAAAVLGAAMMGFVSDAVAQQAAVRVLIQVPSYTCACVVGPVGS